MDVVPVTVVPQAAAAPAVVIGAGPAGLMAAQALVERGQAVEVYDSMPTVGRKFLLAGIGGLNLTHAEPVESFFTRYGERAPALFSALEDFGPDAVRAWAGGLGIRTFVGSSGRVFPTDMKAAPLLRAWLQRLRAAGVRFHMRHAWQGWEADGALRFLTPDGPRLRPAAATVLALGGASWPRLGSDAAWVPWLAARGVDIAPLAPANCGFDVAPTAPGREGWSLHLRERFAGEPVKTVAAWMDEPDGREGAHRQGEFVLTASGIEGSLVYAFARPLREALAAQGQARLWLDLLPQHTPEQVLAQTRHPRGARTLSTHLKSRLGLHGARMALLHELLPPAELADPVALARAIKALPLDLARARPIAEAISTAGGVRFDALDERLMARAVPGLFCAGEMLDWEAPTGGYLMTACLATGHAAGRAAADWLDARAAPAGGVEAA